MRPEEHIAASKSIEEALSAFRESVNRPGTIFSTDHWLHPKLGQLQGLLSNPITQEEAEALLDVLYQRHWMADLIGWLESGRPASWENFVEYRANLEQEEIVKRADERERRRAAGLDPYLNFELVPDDFYPKISDTCPDCGSSAWKPIVYGLPTEDTQEDVRRRHVVLGGCELQDPSRYCLACFNCWPTKPDVSKPTGKPEWIKRQIIKSRSRYARLSTLAELPRAPDEPHVERAWARIDGSVRFLISFGEQKARIAKSLEYARLGGAPSYHTSFSSWCSDDEHSKYSTLAAVAALRFERSHQPEGHNLYNEWDKVQAHRRKIVRQRVKESFHREYVKQNRKKISDLLKLARAFPDKLPEVVSMRSFDGYREFLVRFSWGVVSVERHRFSLLEPLQYRCNSLCTRARDPELAQDVACAAAMLAEFPRLVRAEAPQALTE